MQGVLCVVLRSDLLTVLVKLALELFAHIILFFETLLQVMRSCILVVHQLLFILRELLDVAVEHLDLFQRSRFDMCQIAHQLLIVHLKVALVTYAIQSGILLRQLAFLVAANLTNRLATSLAVPNWVAITQA